MTRKHFPLLVIAALSMSVHLVVMSNTSAEDRASAAEDPINACFVRDSAQNCADLLGIAFGGERIYCDDCSVGKACSGQFVRANAGLSQQQYEKNRAVSVKMQRGGGYSNVALNEILCGTRALCNVTCIPKEEAGSRVPFCPVLFQDAEILFFDLSGVCPSPQHLPVEEVQE